MNKLAMVAASLALLAGCSSFHPDSSHTETHRAIRLRNGMIVVTDSDHDALLVDAPTPTLSGESKGLHGKVQAEIKVSAQGDVLAVKIVSSSDDRLSAAVKSTVKKWSYIPAVLRGEIIDSVIKQEFDFH